MATYRQYKAVSNWTNLSVQRQAYPRVFSLSVRPRRSAPPLLDLSMLVTLGRTEETSSRRVVELRDRAARRGVGATMGVAMGYEVDGKVDAGRMMGGDISGVTGRCGSTTISWNKGRRGESLCQDMFSCVHSKMWVVD